jgi:hypothetical protein
MNNFLSDYIFSVASKSREKIQDVLRAAQVGKADIDSIEKRLANFSSRATFSTRPEVYGSIISSVNLDSVSRDFQLRMGELFDESNLISLLLDSHTEILSSETQRLEDQLNSFEKHINNHNFMLADGGFYDFSYTEPFYDDLGKEFSLTSISSDRTSPSFDITKEVLEVDEGAGALVMSVGFEKKYPLGASIIRSNCAPYVSSDTGIEKSANKKQREGWRVSISSPRSISSSLEEGANKGAQFEVDYTLLEPGLCNSLALSPLADLGMQILSIKLHSGDDNIGSVNLIDEPIEFNKKTILNFDTQSVGRVSMILNQPIFKQGFIPVDKAEKDYVKAYRWQKDNSLSFPQAKKHSEKAFRRLYSKWFLKTEQQRGKLVLAEADLEKYSGLGETAQSRLSYEKDANNLYSRFKLKNRNGPTIFANWMVSKLFQNQPELLDRFTNVQTERKSTTSFSPVLSMTEERPDSSYLNRVYSLGVKSVEIGFSTEFDRGLFVSNIIPAPTQSGEIRLKSSDVNYYSYEKNLDNKSLTSIEYSVTNQPNPHTENLWIPIIPSNNIGEVVNERLFPQSSGYATLRFRVQSQGFIELFKNGIFVDAENVIPVRSEDTASIIGIRIPKSHFSLNPDDIYTCNYMPEGDPSTVNFADYGLESKHITSAFDDNGAGEVFSGTGSSLSVTLANYPYVDFVSIQNNTAYSDTFGLTGLYQPIKVALADGTIAVNYTNYQGLRHRDLASVEKLSFMHSGNSIIFNKAVDQEFRVFYQYEPSYLRYRVIFRVNYPTRLSPQVDSVTVKSKMNASILGLNEKKV